MEVSGVEELGCVGFGAACVAVSVESVGVGGDGGLYGGVGMAEVGELGFEGWVEAGGVRGGPAGSGVASVVGDLDVVLPGAAELVVGVDVLVDEVCDFRWEGAQALDDGAKEDALDAGVAEAPAPPS